MESGQGKKFLEKNLEIKTLGKKSEFAQVIGKNVTGNKTLCFGFLGLFSWNSIGAAKKVSGNKITGNKVPKKKNPRKKS